MGYKPEGCGFLGNAETYLTYVMDGFDYEWREKERDPKDRLEFDSEVSKQVVNQMLPMPNLKYVSLVLAQVYN